MFLKPDHLEPFAKIEQSKAEAMIADAEAMAATVAPCLTADKFLADEARVAAVRAVLRGAVLRWHDSGNGAITQATAGSFSKSVDTRTTRKGMFWPSEIAQLRDMCAEFSGKSSVRRAFAVDTAPAGGWGAHSPICDLAFGGLRCSCGSDLNRFEGPLWEGGILS